MTRRLATRTLALVLSLTLYRPRSAPGHDEPDRPVRHGTEYGIA